MEQSLLKEHCFKQYIMLQILTKNLQKYQKLIEFDENLLKSHHEKHDKAPHAPKHPIEPSHSPKKHHKHKHEQNHDPHRNNPEDIENQPTNLNSNTISEEEKYSLPQKHLKNLFLDYIIPSLQIQYNFTYQMAQFTPIHHLKKVKIVVELQELKEHPYNNLRKQIFTHINTVQHLNLIISYKNDLGPQGSIQIGKSIEKLEKIQKLDLLIDYYNEMKPEGALSLGNSLTKLKDRLICLNLTVGGWNGLKSDGVKGICEGISNLQKLQKLNLTLWNNNRVGTNGAKAVGECLQKLGQLKSLQLVIGSENFIKVEGVKALGIGISKLQELECLNMRLGYDNHVFPEGVEVLSAGLSKCLKLNKLTMVIKDNGIGPLGAQLIGEGILRLPRLEFDNLKLVCDYDWIALEPIKKRDKKLHSKKGCCWF